MHVSFDYNKVNRIGSEDYQEILRFENKGLKRDPIFQVWKLVPRPKERSSVGIKWVFRNKIDSDFIIIRNKAKLVVKGYSQQ